MEILLSLRRLQNVLIMNYWNKFFNYFIPLLFILLLSCNDDVFINELKIPNTELHLSCNEDSVSIKIKSKDWMILSVESDYPNNNEGFWGSIYDKDGNDVYGYDISFFYYGLRSGKMVYEDITRGFTLERGDDDFLKIKVNDNITKNNFQFLIQVSDQYKTIPITIIQSPGAKYVFENITYNYIPGSYEQINQITNYSTVSNNSDTPLCIDVKVFNEKSKLYNFSAEKKQCFSLLEVTDSIPVPSHLENKQLVFQNDKLPYIDRLQKLSSGYENTIKTISVDKGVFSIKVYNEYYKFKTEYEIIFRNEETGKLKSIKGFLTVQLPTDFYLVLKEKLQDL